MGFGKDNLSVKNIQAMNKQVVRLKISADQKKGRTSSTALSSSSATAAGKENQKKKRMNIVCYIQKREENHDCVPPKAHLCEVALE